jgi:hypothetical protein
MPPKPNPQGQRRAARAGVQPLTATGHDRRLYKILEEVVRHKILYNALYCINSRYIYNAYHFLDMKKTLFLFALLMGTINLSAQTAEEIVEKHLAAMGGDALNNLKTMKMEVSLSIQQAPGMVILMTMTVVNNKAMRKEVSFFGMTETTCINGDQGWATNPLAGKTDAEPMTADQVKSMKDMTDLAGPLHNYKAKGYTVEYEGKEDFEGTQVHKLKVTKSPTRTEYILIDPANWYNVKNITGVTVDGMEETSESVNYDFKAVDGVVMAHTVKQNAAMGGKSVMIITSAKYNLPVDEKIFEMPTKK